MSAHHIVSLLRRGLVIGVVGLALPAPGLGSDQAPPQELSVKIFPDHYVAGGERFFSLEALEAWIKPRGVRAVRLDACGQASRQLFAVVQRLSRARVKEFEIRADDEAGCSPAGTESVVVLRGGARLVAETEYLATDRYGRSTMP